jgi:uncharacterized protein YbjT (DUF2867 family)
MQKRIFVAGGSGFLGFRVVRALLEQEAKVTVLVRPDNEDKLGTLRSKVDCVEGDVWNPASLKGRARGHSAVIHLVGGLKPDPSRGLTFRHLNFVSARNVAQMAVSDGVPHFVLLSAAVAPFGAGSSYLDSKRDAEEYLRKTGLTWTIIRAPALFDPGRRRNPMYLLMSLVGYIPLLGMALSTHTPLAVDTAARGIASLAISGDTQNDRLIGPRQLRRLGRAQEKKLRPVVPVRALSEDRKGDDDEPPFGWLPPR